MLVFAVASASLCTCRYGKDPVAIASAAIKEACMKGTDVVLVDTAGRMQNNAGLMGQIAKVVAVNKPDLVSSQQGTDWHPIVLFPS